jgi:REP element-mobilizing transposase RayT
MRKLRELVADTWYFVGTAVNNREPLFWLPKERARLEQVLNEAREIYGFELRGLRFSGPWVMFYIRPADGLQLPEIMQWVKQTYSVRYNLYDGRTGHIWGDRYASEIVPGEPPEWAEAYVFAVVACPVSRRVRKRRTADRGGGEKRGASADDPARDAEGRPRTERRAVKPPPQPDFPRLPAALHG